MRNDDAVIPNIPEIKTVSASSSPRDQIINTTSEGRASSSNSSSSSSSSPSDLRRRLQDLPSPNEFTLRADRVATLGRRISRKRELFLRLHGVANRIEENNEWEEREQRAGPEGSPGAFRSKDARARRRARARLETSSNGFDKAMVISQTGDPAAPLKTTDSDDKSNLAETNVDRSARGHSYLQSSAIEVSRWQSQSTSLSEPNSTRSTRHNNVAWHDTNSNPQSFRNFTSRDSASRSLDLPSVAPFSLSNARPKKFGGYRPSSGMILKNLSSGSESESVSGTNRGQTCVRKIDDVVATLELSSPESKSTADNGPANTMPVMSARSDVTGSILPNLLSSTGSQKFSRTAYVCGQQNRNESSTGFSNQAESIASDARAFYNKQASHDEPPTTKIPNLPWHIAAKYECDGKQENALQNTSSFSARSFISESPELVTSARNEQIQWNLPKNYDCAIVPEICHDEIKDRCRFNRHSTDQLNVKINCPENGDEHVFDATKWGQIRNFCVKETADVPDFIATAETGVTEHASSSEMSEMFASEDHSRSSCTAKMCLRKTGVSASRRCQNDTDTSDKCDREVMGVTDVPMLALNSQDISYSTSTGSRECSAMRPLDPHALIKALSDVSLKQGREGSASRKRDDRPDNDTYAVSDLATKGETWRIPRSSTSGSPRRSLIRVPSRIPVRVSSNKNISFTNINKFSESYKNPEASRKMTNDEEAQSIDRSNVQSQVSVIHQRLMTGSSYPANSKQYSSQRPKDENTDVTIVTAHSSRFQSDDGAAGYEANDCKPGSFVSSSLQSPQTPSGNEIYDKVGCLSGGAFNGNCPVFFNEASYSSNRDYARIDDDVRSKSDRSTSRKSMETVDITSATGSPCLPRCKRDSIPGNELSRNAKGNAAWRTEDECASINNEEDPEDPEHKDCYDPYRNKTEEIYLQTTGHFESGTEEMYDWCPSKSQFPQIDLSLEIERIARKQSRAKGDRSFDNDEPNRHHNLELTKEAENLTSQACRTQETSSFAAKMSTLNLNYEAKRKRKSQERFPFTISEASGVLSTEHVDTSDYRLSDKGFSRAKMDDPLLEEKSVYQLKAHPSITRLASSGLEDTVAEILCCVAQEQQENESSSKSRMRALVRIFSSKLRRTSKQRNDNRKAEPAKIIYENRACQVDSKTNSYSSVDSSAEKVHRLNLGRSPDNCWIDHSSNSMLVLDGNILKKTESLEAIIQEHPRRKYDRDNLWVRDIKGSFLNEHKDDKTTQDEEDVSKRDPRDQRSIFLAKDYQSDELSKSDNDHNPRKREQDLLVQTSSHSIPEDGKDKGNTDQKVSPNFVSQVEKVEEDPTGCLCLRLCCSFTPSRHRLSIREQASSSKTKKSSFLLRKKKK